MPKATESTNLSDQHSTLTRPDGTDDILDETATEARVGRIAARLAGSDLDAESMELITAALTADVCDDINAVDA
jgi:hypothetical protein